ncbi:hypothetical protein ACOT81_43160 [Streptomyces sp. WI04-05B]|uniref:hypothetical protein n=1 Tax=Streptomyces TaxID=1883 RepID=UPI0029AD3AB1|nr:MULTISPECIES: hypothetical protein [unclassified Streptomyces]MDX2543383.1 hypothetical protein [Streptomyces sp. WI04-05B]MDX2586785.1 hypothetical protein [Streptomyces sp. WI04-05A]
MSENNERPKPPARRTGRALGGAKKTTPPPPPPAAELTPEQFATEQAAAQGEGRPDASEPQVQPAGSSVPIGVSAAQDPTEMMAEVAQAPVAPRVEAAPGSPVRDPAASQPARPAVVASEAGTESPVVSMEGQALGQTVAPAAQPSVPAAQPTPSAEHVSQHGASQDTGAALGVAHTAEVAIHSTVLPVTGAAAFPVSAGAANPQHEQQARSDTAPSNGTSWKHGSGRPKDIPEAAVILNQRIIARESLDSSVPAALKLKKRIKRFALDNELDHLPMGDIVSVALDEWLTIRGF